MTIDTTAAYLAPSHQVETDGPVFHSLVHKSHQKRQIRSGDIHNYDFHSERSKWLRMAIDRAKQSIAVPPKTSNPYNRIRPDRQVPFVFHHFYILYFHGKKPIEILFFQVHDNQIQKTTILEETIVKDATVPEQVAQEIIINNRKVTRISAGAYKGYLQESLLINNFEPVKL